MQFPDRLQHITEMRRRRGTSTLKVKVFEPFISRSHWRINLMSSSRRSHHYAPHTFDQVDKGIILASNLEHPNRGEWPFRSKPRQVDHLHQQVGRLAGDVTILQGTVEEGSRKRQSQHQRSYFWGKRTWSYLTAIKNLWEGSFPKIIAMAQGDARSHNGDDAELEDEVDERAQLMDISDNECKSRYVYYANYLLLYPQNSILADANAVAASRLGLHQFCGNALVPGHIVGPCSISHSRSFINILSLHVYPADSPPLPYLSCPLLLLSWIQYA